ncbi:hypothetical protein CR513_62118, partial [Mucuna pruriens]
MFDWVPDDMPKIDLDSHCQKLMTNPIVKHVSWTKEGLMRKGTKQQWMNPIDLLKLGLIGRLNTSPGYPIYKVANKFCLVDKTFTRQIHSLMDIHLNLVDEYKIVFITNNSNFCYQWLMDKIFKGKIVKNLEVYIDYIVVKAIEANNHTKLECSNSHRSSHNTLQIIVKNQRLAMPLLSMHKKEK